MTRDEAKPLLQSLRPDGSDLNDPVFAEALALAWSDPELKSWWEAQQSFDRGIVAKIEEIAPPSSLRDSILTRYKTAPFSTGAYLGPWFALAAALVLVAVVQNVFFSGPRPVVNPPMLSDTYTSSVLPFLSGDKPSLGMTSPDHGQVAAWLKERSAPAGDLASLPAGLAALPSVGCQRFEVRGHAVSLICFTLSGGGLAHLFIVSQKALIDPPGDLPEYSQKGEWSTAAWSQDGMSYILATRAGPQALQSLL